MAKRRERERRPPEDGGPEDPRFVAAIDLIGRTGSSSFQIRYDEEQDPIVWVAVAEYRAGTRGRLPDGGRVRLAGDRPAYEVAGALTPLGAVMRLLDALVDGGQCAHCRRPSGVTDDWERRMPLDDVFCWYVYDPELRKFRRSCEGET